MKAFLLNQVIGELEPDPKTNIGRKLQGNTLNGIDFICIVEAIVGVKNVDAIRDIQYRSAQ